MTTTAPSGYRNDRPYPFCPGCGHGPILDALNAALVARDADPARVVIVSDIGCSGLSDQYFDTSAFHGLHGRSITYASGIKLARPDLDVVVVMGDGGTGIGGAHLLSAARRNIGMTVLVFNNLNFGMTGGQHSATTPEGGLTPTTPAEDSIESPRQMTRKTSYLAMKFRYLASLAAELRISRRYWHATRRGCGGSPPTPTCAERNLAQRGRQIFQTPWRFVRI